MIIRNSIVLVNPADDLQATVDALPASGGTILLSRGTYTLTATLTFPVGKAVRLVGEGATNTIITISDTALNNTDIIKVQGTYCSIQSLSVVGCAVSGTGRGIVVGNPGQTLHYFTMTDVVVNYVPHTCLYFMGFDDGADTLTVLSQVFRCRFYGNKNSAGRLLFIGRACTTICFQSCSFEEFLGNAAFVDRTEAIRFRDCAFENRIQDTAHWLFLSGTWNTRVEDCWFEWDGFTAAYWKILVASYPSLPHHTFGVVISGCNFETDQLELKAITIGANNVAGGPFDMGIAITDCWALVGNGVVTATNMIDVSAYTVGVVLRGGGVVSRAAIPVLTPWNVNATGAPDGYRNDDAVETRYLSFNDELVTYDDEVVYT